MAHCQSRVSCFAGDDDNPVYSLFVSKVLVWLASRNYSDAGCNEI